MNKYYIHYYRPFGNTYNLYSVDQKHQADLQALENLRELHPNDTIERITLKEAMEKIKWTRFARERLNEPYGAIAITPIWEVGQTIKHDLDAKRNYDEERGDL